MRKRAMSIQDQVYKQIQARVQTICASEYNQVPKTRKGRLKRPLQYPAIVEELIALANAVLDMKDQDAESVCHEITHGEFQEAFLKAKGETER